MSAQIICSMCGGSKRDLKGFLCADCGGTGYTNVVTQALAATQAEEFERRMRRDAFVSLQAAKGSQLLTTASGLTPQQFFRLIEIAHETKDERIKRHALGMIEAHHMRPKAEAADAE